MTTAIKLREVAYPSLHLQRPSAEAILPRDAKAPSEGIHVLLRRALRPESWKGFTFWAVALLLLTAAAEIAGFLLL